MPIIPVASTSVGLTSGGVWRMAAAVVDYDALAVTAPPTVTITLPDNTTLSPVPELVTTGGFVVDYLPVAEGRYVAHWASAYGAADFAAYVTAVVPAAAMPDLAEFKLYAGIDPLDTDRDAEIDNALAAEGAAQRAVCRVPAAYPADLREALLRRTARNLALRLLPLAVLRGDADAGTDNMVLPGRDPEVRRLEAPHRKMIMG